MDNRKKMIEDGEYSSHGSGVRGKRDTCSAPDVRLDLCFVRGFAHTVDVANYGYITLEQMIEVLEIQGYIVKKKKEVE